MSLTNKYLIDQLKKRVLFLEKKLEELEEEIEKLKNAQTFASGG